MSVPVNLRQLLVMINGVRTVSDLLKVGISGVDLVSFDTLHELGMIEGPRNAANSRLPPPALASKKGLSEARFAVLDILLDIGEKDLGVRPWVEKIEQADSMARLLNEIEAFCVSPFGRKYSSMHNMLRIAATE
ncbi:MAG: hypothetical protein KDI50_10740 [Candidatus Competibacteraceae bacterium]|nr:hypothetical protein [Candidatus Competibacteraceae bacterium]